MFLVARKIYKVSHSTLQLPGKERPNLLLDWLPQGMLCRPMRENMLI